MVAYHNGWMRLEKEREREREESVVGDRALTTT